MLMASLSCLTTASNTNDDELVSDSNIMIIGGKGPAQIITHTEAAFWRIYNDTNRSSRFRQILSEASPAGKAYCLFGLYYSDRTQYEQIAISYREINDGFVQQGGCVITSNSMSLFLKLLESGVFDPVIKKTNSAQQGRSG